MIIALIIADVLMAGAFALKFTSLPPQIPLIYSNIWGEEQLVDYWFIFILPLSLHLFFFLNIYLYNKFFFPDHVLRKVVFILNSSLTVAFTLIFLKIIFYIS
ncbi:MAG: hypothetical protein HYW86_02010 [Candidatus Roizmanbacteria bacterium]|nr:MAG: hypothetical protein HYW86_02010 [Candidatus Roizmanbacteria bacterium]